MSLTNSTLNILGREYAPGIILAFCCFFVVDTNRISVPMAALSFFCVKNDIVQ